MKTPRESSGGRQDRWVAQAAGVCTEHHTRPLCWLSEPPFPGSVSRTVCPYAGVQEVSEPPDLYTFAPPF